MKQVAALISTYSSDEFGVCSALYELGGMVVMHDASGCNSTYTTHDEPRWYDMDSMIYISAISEMEAIMGDDEKLINDITETAAELHPKFIAVVGAPIPYMIGTDFQAIAEILEHKTGVPCFGFEANGMDHYTRGISMALEAIVDRFALTGKENSASAAYDSSADGAAPREARSGAVVNLLGATPLDFSLNGSIESIEIWLEKNGFKTGASIAMGCSLEDISRAGEADLNLVLSYGGLAAARLLEKRFGTPYVVGIPVGAEFAAHLAGRMRGAIETGKSLSSYMDIPAPEEGGAGWIADVGESVYQASVAAAAAMEQGVDIRVLCPLDTDDMLMRPQDRLTPEEDDIMEAIKEEGCRGFMADPMYRPLLPQRLTFYALPHEAFSGRIYDSVNPNLIDRPLAESLYDFRK